ncbi:hypothetical protein BD769DRAFT_1631099 [Suillus cothurnatus]|nr:hypothetical protein BD769DRAFT_1631099 [Suillus cothurnatus]
MHRPRRKPRSPKKITRFARAGLGVAHIYASFNDTFVHETISRVTGGMKVKAIVMSRPLCRYVGCSGCCHALPRGRHHRPPHQAPCNWWYWHKTPGPGAQSALRALARAGMRIGRIEDVTPVPTDSTRRKGGRRGRRL